MNLKGFVTSLLILGCAFPYSAIAQDDARDLLTNLQKADGSVSKISWFALSVNCSAELGSIARTAKENNWNFKDKTIEIGKLQADGDNFQKLAMLRLKDDRKISDDEAKRIVKKIFNEVTAASDEKNKKSLSDKSFDKIASDITDVCELKLLDYDKETLK